MKSVEFDVGMVLYLVLGCCLCFACSSIDGPLRTFSSCSLIVHCSSTTVCILLLLSWPKSQVVITCFIIYADLFHFIGRMFKVGNLLRRCS